MKLGTHFCSLCVTLLVMLSKLTTSFLLLFINKYRNREYNMCYRQKICITSPFCSCFEAFHSCSKPSLSVCWLLCSIRRPVHGSSPQFGSFSSNSCKSIPVPWTGVHSFTSIANKHKHKHGQTLTSVCTRASVQVLLSCLLQSILHTPNTTKSWSQATFILPGCNLLGYFLYITSFLLISPR